jgi:hypothetical protein
MNRRGIWWWGLYIKEKRKKENKAIEKVKRIQIKPMKKQYKCQNYIEKEKKKE